MKFSRKTRVYRIAGPAGMYVNELVVFFGGEKCIEEWLKNSGRKPATTNPIPTPREIDHFMNQPLQIDPRDGTILDLWNCSREYFENSFTIEFLESRRLS